MSRSADFSCGHKQLRQIVTASAAFRSCAAKFGDLLRLRSNTVLMNLGYRTPAEKRDEIFRIMSDQGISQIGIMRLPRELLTAHLDLDLNAFGPKRLVCSSHAAGLHVEHFVDGVLQDNMDLPSFCQAVGRKLDIMPVHANPIADVNFIHLEPDRILTSSSATVLEDHGHQLGIHVETVDIDGLLAGGGGIRCMTCPLQRDTLHVSPAVTS